MATDRHQPQLDLDETTTGYRHRYCRRCGRPLTAETSRFRGFGDHCGPTRQPAAAPARHIDQDPLPGTWAQAGGSSSGMTSTDRRICSIVVGNGAHPCSPAITQFNAVIPRAYPCRRP